MAIQQRISTIRLTTGTGTRTWNAEAAVLKTPAGNSVTITINVSVTGLGPPATADTFQLSMRIDNTNTIVRTFTLTPGTGTQTVSFFFTNDGTNTGTGRLGTIRLRLFAENTTALAGARYTLNSDDTTGEVLPTGGSVTIRDRGHILSTGTSTQSLSNISLGAGKNSPFQVVDSLFIRTTFSHQLYSARAITIALKNGTTAYRLAATASQSSGNFDVTFSGTSASLGRVNNGFLAASSVYFTDLTIPNATESGIPAFDVTNTQDTATIDPKITALHILMISATTTPPIASPPFSSNKLSTQRVFPQNGYILTFLMGARGTFIAPNTTGGINGIGFNINLVAQATGEDRGSTGYTTTTQGGETGWQDTLLIWTAVVGGQWLKTVVITTADLAGASYITNSTATYILNASNPNIAILTGAGNALSSLAGRHFSPGNALIVVAAVRDVLNRVYVTPDPGTFRTTLLRLNPVTGIGEYLRASDITWQPANGVAADEFSLTVSPADDGVYSKVFSAAQTLNWGEFDFIVNSKADVAGIVYYGRAVIDAVGNKNPHDRNELDPTDGSLM